MNPADSAKRGRGRPKEVGRMDDFMASVETCRDLIRKTADTELWDAVKAKDVPQEVIDFVIARTNDGFTASQIRRQLGLCGDLSAAWQKIMAAIRGGARVESGVVFRRIVNRSEKLVSKLEQILDTITDDARTGKIKKSAKRHAVEISALVGSITQLQRAAIQTGNDLGIYVQDVNKGGAGVKIVVQNNIPMPTQEAIDNARALEVKPTTSVTVIPSPQEEADE